MSAQNNPGQRDAYIFDKYISIYFFTVDLILPQIYIYNNYKKSVLVPDGVVQSWLNALKLGLFHLFTCCFTVFFTVFAASLNLNPLYGFSLYEVPQC